MSGSRYRTDVATLFDVFCEVIASDFPGEPPQLRRVQPDDFAVESIFKTIRQFALPSVDREAKKRNPSSDAVQLYAFALTDESSQLSFGFCRYTPRNRSCLCLVTGLPWMDFFYRLLNHVANIMNSGSDAAVESFLVHAYHTEIPEPGSTHAIGASEPRHAVRLDVPDLSRLPSLADCKHMLEFYNAVEARQMIALYSGLLRERRIVITGRRIGSVSSCVFAATQLLWPMTWQYLFIPLLPDSLVDMLHAPMPYLMGVPKHVWQDTKKNDLGELLVVDLDERSLSACYDDTAELPAEVVNGLRTRLKQCDMDDHLARTFLRAQAAIFGHYRSGFAPSDDEGGDLTFSTDRFLAATANRPTLEPYLRKLLGSGGVQYFERFIADRQQALNSGAVLDDEFEREVLKEGVKWKMTTAPSPSSTGRSAEIVGALKGRVKDMQDRLPKAIVDSLRRNRSEPMSSFSFDNRVLSGTDCPETSARSSASENVEFAVGSVPSTSNHNEPAPRPETRDLIDFDDSTATSRDPVSLTDPFADLLNTPSSFSTSSSPGTSRHSKTTASGVPRPSHHRQFPSAASAVFYSQTSSPSASLSHNQKQTPAFSSAALPPALPPKPTHLTARPTSATPSLITTSSSLPASREQQQVPAPPPHQSRTNWQTFD